MASVNKVIIVGNVGRDPETRYMPSGDAVTNISVATSDRYKDKQSGEMKETTEWHRVAFFGKLAEIAGQYLKKGSQVYVEGRLRTRKWTDASGQEKYSTEIVAETMQMLGGKPVGGSGDGGESYSRSKASEQSAPAKEELQRACATCFHRPLQSASTPLPCRPSLQTDPAARQTSSSQTARYSAVPATGGRGRL